MWRLVIQLVLVTNVYSAQVCDFSNSVDISDFANRTNLRKVINARGVKYAQNQYYQDVASGTTRGCNICKDSDKICIRKCCDFGYSYRLETKKCVRVEKEFHAPVWNKYRPLDGKDAMDMFSFVTGKQVCSPQPRISSLYISKNIHLREDGSLYMEMPNQIPPYSIIDVDRYCIDTFLFENATGAVSTSLEALVCFAEDQKEEHYALTISCMLISCVFFLATCAVYWFLPELRNLHGQVLLAYLICLLVAFVFLATMQILILLNGNSPSSCLGFTFVIYFFLLSAFFWLNVMCFDIWWTFSGNRGLALGKLSKRGRFCAYATYAFGIPSLLTILLAALEFSGLPAHVMLPMIKLQGCFLAGTSKLVYLYGPIVILCCANMTFFILTALKITKIKQQTAVLKSGESSTHDQHRNDKQRLSLYIKLFIVMGINWILEVASACYPQAEYIWLYTDAYNVLIGVPIFVIFVFKRKIWHLLKKRMKEKLQRRNSGVGDLKKFDKMHRKRLNKYGPRVSVETLRSTIYITDSDGSAKEEKTSKV